MRSVVLQGVHGKAKEVGVREMKVDAVQGHIGKGIDCCAYNLAIDSWGGNQLFCSLMRHGGAWDILVQ